MAEGKANKKVEPVSATQGSSIDTTDMDKSLIRRRAGSLLLVLGLFGLNSMYGQLYRSGYMRQIIDTLSSPNPSLPGSNTPLLTHYTGLPLFDRLLATASVLWVNVTDGSSPALSLYMAQFLGQLLPLYLVMIIEGDRSAHSGSIMGYSVLWGFMMQGAGHALTMPAYGALHLFASPLSAAISGKGHIHLRYPLRLNLRVLIPAFSLGYLAPTLLMAWPFSSPALHQWLGAFWQGFPLYVTVLQRVFTWVLQSTTQSTTPAATVSRAYDWAFGFATFIQLSVYALITAAKISPSSFPSWAAESFSFEKVFLPGPFYSTQPFTSPASAMHNFFMWEQCVGSAAAITWGVTLDMTSRRHAMSRKDWFILGWDVVRWTTMAGPAGALVRLLQRRAEAVSAETVKSS